ncbi:retrovirus-related Pol polyprotein from transposon 17.6 [Trichonephila clavipes]|nr:retrovirus-related Pol polyprotein from transposon 17.6 [Trichonephila clavipes]
MAEPSKHTSRLFLLDRKSGQKFLIDSGSEICVIPPSPTMNKSPQSNFSLFAANNTKIPAYGMVRKELNLGLRRPFIWTFIIADVSSPIIGADFLKHFNLLIDLKKKRLSSYGLKLNISKCVFGVTELIFLGHLITPDGIKPLPDKVQAVLDYKQPETVGSLRKFLGLLNFYRRFLPKAAEQQYLLSEFLKGSKGKKDSKPLNWSSEAITAFQRCKQALADAALLAHPSPSAPLALHVDASDYAIGGALHQVVDSELQPLAFFPENLLHLKSLTVPMTVNSLLSTRLSDTFGKSDKCSPRQIRQLDFISQFTTNIVHIPGSDNIAADVLSRVSAITFPSQIDYDCIAETQQTDQELHTLIASGTSLELKR